MGEQFDNDEIEIDLLEFLYVIKKKIWLVIICLVAGVTVTGLYTQFAVTPQYEASSMLYILTKTTSVTSLADIQMGTQLTADFETLALSRPVVETVIKNLEIKTTYEELVGRIATTNPPDTRILKITVTSAFPESAQLIANEMASVTASRMAEVMSTDPPSIVEDAVIPKAPVSPSMKKNCAIGGLLATFLAIAVLLVIYMLDDSIKTEEDIARYLNLNTLASIPMEKGQTQKKKRKKLYLRGK